MEMKHNPALWRLRVRCLWEPSSAVHIWTVQCFRKVNVSCWISCSSIWTSLLDCFCWPTHSVHNLLLLCKTLVVFIINIVIMLLYLFRCRSIFLSVFCNNFIKGMERNIISQDPWRYYERAGKVCILIMFITKIFHIFLVISSLCFIFNSHDFFIWPTYVSW